MRMIQTKLSTPTNSSDRLNQNLENREVQMVPQEKQAVVLEEKPSRIISQYRPPSINLSTWSERPKTQISVKEDTDYKMKNGTSKIIVNAEPKKTVEITNNNNNVSIKVNGSDPIVSQGAGNVIIKIGANRTEQKPRPHSVAIDTSTEVSRVPIVRSVELKKPFRDNRSVTQICPDETNFYKSNFSITTTTPDLTFKNTLENTRRVSDTLNGLKQSGSDSNFYVGAETRPVFRSITNAPPVVRGFRANNDNSNSNPSAYRKSWNVNGTLPEESNKISNNALFGNVVLRNTQSRSHRSSVGAFPPPPQMPKTTKSIERNSADPRDELLSAIRNFGGKKGLKSIKA